MSAQEFLAYKVGKAIYLYLSPLILVIGLVGNSMSLLVVSKHALKPPTMYMYMSMLAVADILALVIPCFTAWLKIAFHVDLPSTLSCGWYYMLWFTTTNISVYIVVNMTIDRFLCVYFPLASKSICTVRRTVVGIIVVSVIQCAINIHFTWGFTALEKISGNATVIQCSPLPNMQHFYYHVWTFVDFTIYSFLPVAILVVLNILIVCKTYKQKQLMKNALSSTSTSTLNKTQHRMTVTLVMVCVSLVVTTTPVVVLHIVEPFWNRNDPRQQAVHMLTKAICEHLMYLNNCINFVLYLLSGRKFRDELRRVLLRGLRRARVHPEGTSQTSGGQGIFSSSIPATE